MTVRYLGRHATFLEPDLLSLSLSLSPRREIRCAFSPSRYCGAVLVHCVPSPFRSPEVD